jgi:predicted nuclease of predicted toxin-antitoxin system
VRIRILCDENVPVATVEALDDRGITATPVTDRPGAGTDDEGVARFASETGAILLTNDHDFLDETRFDDVRVFYYPENDVDPYRLVRRVTAVLEMVRDVDDLPERVFLTAAYDEDR